MINPSTSLVQPDVLNENMLTIHSFLRESYTQAKTHLQNGISAFKDEFREIYYQTESYFSRMALPINNFLKDHTEIDAEFQQGSVNEPGHNNNVVPIEIALQSPMEENY